MAIQNWSDNITVVELADDPQFSDEINGLMEALERTPKHVVLNFAAVGFINSSNVAKLLRLRKTMMSQQRRLILCEVNTQVWGVFLVTGLDKIFEFTNDIATALASLQLGEEAGAERRAPQGEGG
jgi:anti-anti-sigma factor